MKARNVTEARIRALRTENMRTPEFSRATCPANAERSTWRLAIETDCALALGELEDAPSLSECANRETEVEAFKRCNEYLELARRAGYEFP